MTESAENTAPTLWGRLRSRKVVQWGLGYVAVAWGLLQGTEFAVTTFHWPERSPGLPRWPPSRGCRSR